MDKVLTRKLFKQRYIESQKPQVKKLKEGGIFLSEEEGGLSRRDKALYAATLAAPFLKGTQAPGESMLTGALRSFGEGLEKIPATALAIEKSRPKAKAFIRQATSAEKKELGYNDADRLTVKVDGGTVVGIADKPTNAERKDSAKRNSVINSGTKIFELLEQEGYPTGTIEGRVKRFASSFGMYEGVARLDVEIENFKKDAIQALRGAQVGPLEEASFDAILPKLTDRPAVIKAKMATAMRKIKDLDDRMGAGGFVSDPGNIDGYLDSFIEFGVKQQNINYAPNAATFEIKDGVLIQK